MLKLLISQIQRGWKLTIEVYNMEVTGELEKNNFDKVVGQKPDWSRLERIEGKELDAISIDNSLEEFAAKGRK